MKFGLVQRLALFCFAVSGLANAAALQSDRDLFADLRSSRVSTWAVADFDGDSQTDLVTGESLGRYSNGFQHEVRLNFSASPPRSFIFSSRTSRIRLRARDVDGDDDRDLVVIESYSSKLVGVWLNDGSGNFRIAEGSRFPAAGETKRSVSRAVSDPDLSVSPALIDDPAEIAVSEVPDFELASNNGSIGRELTSVPRDADSSIVRDRAPPFFF